MEYFTLCLKIIQKEKKICKLDHQEIIKRTMEFSLSDNFFESPYDRCAFMYKNATCIINFTKDCVYKFLTECSFVTDILFKWKIQSSLHFCSFSHGPALDYLSFCVALSENIEANLQPFFNSVNVITNSAQWKHAIHFMIQSIEMGHLHSFPVSTLCDNFNVNQNPQMAFKEKQRIVVQDADVIFMVKTLNFSKPDEFEERKKYFQNIIAAMKSDSYLFCIDTKPSLSAMFDVFCQSSGQLIYGPVLNAYQLPEKFPEAFKEIYGCLPVVSARGNFFVWKKMSLKFQMGNISTNSEKLPTNPIILTDNKANVFNQLPLVKHDIAAELSEVPNTDNKSGDLHSNQNHTLAKKMNGGELTDINVDLSSPLATSIQQSTIANEVKTEDVIKSISSNFCDAGKLVKPVSLLDQLFSNLSTEKPKSPLKTTLKQGVHQSFIIKNSQDLSSESKPLLKTPNDDFNIQLSSIESSKFSSIPFIECPAALNKDLNARKLTDSLAICNSIKETSSSQNINEMCEFFYSKLLGSSEARSLSNIFNDSSNSLKCKPGSIRCCRRKLRRATKSMKASTSHKDIKTVLRSSSVKLIPLYSSVCDMFTSCNSNSIHNNCPNLNTNVGSEGTDKSQVTGREINNSNKNVNFLNAELNKDCKLTDEGKKITHHSINSRNNSICSLVAPNNKKFEFTIDDDYSVSYLSDKTMSTPTDLKKKYMSNCSKIQHLTNRIKILASSLDQKEKGTTLRNKTNKPFHNYFCSCLQNRNASDNNDCFQSSNIATNEKLEEDHKDSNTEFKHFCPLLTSLGCATQFIKPGLHHCGCACECRKVHVCACTAASTYSSHGCLHSAEHCVHLSDKTCFRCVACEQANLTVPNIVIPLQNITEDALAQILAILKVTNPYCPK